MNLYYGGILMTALRQISFQSRAKDNKDVENFKIRKSLS